MNNVSQWKKKKFQYISLGISAVLLIGIGLILDRIGGFGIRTDDIYSPITLTFSEPMLVGVPVTVRWDTALQSNIGVSMRLITKNDTVHLGEGEMLDGSMAVELPCMLPPAPLRLELTDTTTSAMLAVSSVTTISAGPDCIR